jgi:hypothetical protein
MTAACWFLVFAGFVQGPGDAPPAAPEKKPRASTNAAVLETYDTLLRLAAAAADAGDWPRTAVLASNAVDLRPLHAKAYAFLSLALLRSGRLDEADVAVAQLRRFAADEKQLASAQKFEAMLAAERRAKAPPSIEPSLRRRRVAELLQALDVFTANSPERELLRRLRPILVHAAEADLVVSRLDRDALYGIQGRSDYVSGSSYQYPDSVGADLASDLPPILSALVAEPSSLEWWAQFLRRLECMQLMKERKEPEPPMGNEESLAMGDKSGARAPYCVEATATEWYWFGTQIMVLLHGEQSSDGAVRDALATARKRGLFAPTALEPYRARAKAAAELRQRIARERLVLEGWELRLENLERFSMTSTPSLCRGEVDVVEIDDVIESAAEQQRDLTAEAGAEMLQRNALVQVRALALRAEQHMPSQLFEWPEHSVAANWTAAAELLDAAVAIGTKNDWGGRKGAWKDAELRVDLLRGIVSRPDLNNAGSEPQARSCLKSVLDSADDGRVGRACRALALVNMTAVRQIGVSTNSFNLYVTDYWEDAMSSMKQAASLCSSLGAKQAQARVLFAAGILAIFELRCRELPEDQWFESAWATIDQARRLALEVGDKGLAARIATWVRKK